MSKIKSAKYSTDVKRIFDSTGSPTGFLMGWPAKDTSERVMQIDDIRDACGGERILNQEELNGLCGEAGGTLEELLSEQVDIIRAFE